VEGCSRAGADNAKLIVQAPGNHVELWVSVLVILDKGCTHHMSNAAEEARRSKRQAVCWQKICEKAVRKMSAHSDEASASPEGCERPRSEIRVKLLRDEQGSMCSDQDSQLVSDAMAAETDTGLEE
jgi:hypothetical protein